MHKVCSSNQYKPRFPFKHGKIRGSRVGGPTGDQPAFQIKNIFLYKLNIDYKIYKMCMEKLIL